MLRKTASDPGKCPACNGVGSTIKLLGDDPHRPIDVRCESCQGAGYQSERQIAINKGANASILGAMPL
jgi:DnaJ-class molecular chaperone